MTSSKLTISSAFLMFSSIAVLDATSVINFLIFILALKTLKDYIGMRIYSSSISSNERSNTLIYELWGFMNDKTFRNLDKIINPVLEVYCRFIAPAFPYALYALLLYPIPHVIMGMLWPELADVIFVRMNIFYDWFETLPTFRLCCLILLCFFSHSIVISRKCHV